MALPNTAEFSQRRMAAPSLLNRTGHFWEKQYHSTGFPPADKRRALKTLRYIHANPKVANMQQG